MKSLLFGGAKICIQIGSAALVAGTRMKKTRVSSSFLDDGYNSNMVSTLTRTLGTDLLSLAILPHCMFNCTSCSMFHFVLMACPVHIDSMDHIMVSYGQDILTITIQHSRKDRMGNHGGSWLHHAAIPHVLSAETRRN